MQRLLGGRKAPALDPAVARTAHSGRPTERVTPGSAGEPISVYETSASHRAAMRMGVAGYSYRGDVFLAQGLDEPGAPGRARVLKHELVHARQSRREGPPASRDSIEAQADRAPRPSDLFAADPESVYGWLWIPAIIAFGYITTRSNTANAPGPGDKTYPSLTTGDYVKMSGEAALLASGGLVFKSIRAAGFSTVAAWGGSGAVGSIGFRAIDDVSSGSFSGINAYVIDGLTGATVGIVVGGTFHALGRAPGLGRIRNWYNRGAEHDADWAKLSAKEKWLYEIGQKTLPGGQWEPLQHLSPVERGRQLVEQQGWLRALFPRSGGFMVPGEGGTLSTGPTPMFRQWMPRFMTGTAGAVGRHGFLPDWEDSKHDTFGATFGTGFPPQTDFGMGGLDFPSQPDFGMVPESGEEGAVPLPGTDEAIEGRFTAPPGWDTIIVVPEGKEMEYLIKSGQVGDFPLPDKSPDTAYG